MRRFRDIDWPLVSSLFAHSLVFAVGCQTFLLGVICHCLDSGGGGGSVSGFLIFVGLLLVLRPSVIEFGGGLYPASTLIHGSDFFFSLIFVLVVGRAGCSHEFYHYNMPAANHQKFVLR